ncbi:MAG: hypothetical protein VB084_03950 [Syntrophomonadaceae bacterium]|nr:hypothetical protein [Syntrophomonadaceae bacterium]
MSILKIAASRRRMQKPFLTVVTVAVILMLFMTAGFPGIARAGGIGDVVTAVANANFSSTDFEFGNEDETGLNIKMHLGLGEFGNGYGGITVLGPTDAAGMKTMLNYVDGEANHTSIQTKRMKGCEVREYTMSDGAGVGVVLPDYFVTVELYQTGKGTAADIQTALNIAQQTLDGLERAGLLSEAAPDIEVAQSANPEEEKAPASGAAVTGKALDEPVKVSDTNNIAGVYNGPTSPTTFTLSSPHLITFISNYHWNKAKGANPGTIALQAQNGTVYGPWKVATRPGQGGVPNAYWEVSPNIVVPAGTYTVIDSDPATWAQNAESGGRGMGEVRATPHFEVTSGSIANLTDNTKSGKNPAAAGYKESPAGVGAAGNIPGPANTTEAVVGVVVPGLIATALGALGGLGGGGGLVPPASGIPGYPNGGGPGPGTAGTPGTGGGTAGMASATNQIGRRRNEEIYIDTVEMFENNQILTGKTPSDSDILIETENEAGIFVQPEAGIIIDTAHEAGVFVQPESDPLIETAQEASVIRPDSGTLVDGSSDEILFDFKALEDHGTAETEAARAGGEAGTAAPGADGALDKEGFDKEGFDAKGFDKEGFDKEGFDAKGFDKEGFDKDGFDVKGFDKEGFDKDGFDVKGFDKEGFNKDGFDVKGFDKEEFDKDGFDAKGFDKEGFNKDGFDVKGFDKEGFDKDGFDAKGFDKEGFNKAGYDKEGYGRNGFDGEGFDREGYDVNGYNRNGYNRQGFDAKGYDQQGFDKAGFNKDGFDRDGYDRNGFDKNGWDREGYDKNGYDADGYDREGYNREGQSQEGYDAECYDKKGFNEHGYDRDGFDREGFNYEGYNRSGYDPWGYDKQGYAKDGYHWSGYNADGYDRSGRHWTENPYKKDSPFDVISGGAGNPFDGDREVIASTSVEMDAEGNIIGGKNLADSWKPTKPPLGEPYQRIVEKYGAKPWDDESPAPQPEKPTIPSTEDSGVIGPEDPMNTLKNHNPGEETQAAPGGPAETGASIPEADIPGKDIPGYEPVDDIPGDQSAIPDSNTFDYTDPVTGETSTYEYEPGYTGPRHGDRQILQGSGDGQTYEIEFNAVTGKWVNSETGNEFDPDRFQSWQDQVAEDQRWSAAELEKMANRQDANSRAIDKNLADWKRLEQMQKAADKYNVGEEGGPGDVDKAIQDLKNDMLAGKEVDQGRLEQINKIIDNRIQGKTAADNGQRWEEEPWYQDLDAMAKAAAETGREVVTGEDAEGNLSWLGMGARAAIGAATGGASESLFTVAEAMQRIKTAVDSGKDGVEAYTDAIKQLLLEEAGGELIGAAGGKVSKVIADTFPDLTKNAAELVERNMLKIMKADQLASRGLGLVGAESAENAIKQIEKRLAELGGDAAGEAAEKAARAAKRSGAGAGDDAAGLAAKGSTDDMAAGTGKAAAGGSDEVADSVRKGRGDSDAAQGAKGTDRPDRSAIAGKKGADAVDEAADAAGKQAPEAGLNKNARSDAEVLSDPKAVAQAEQALKDKMQDFDKLPEAKKQQLINDQAVYDEYRLQAEGKNWELADKVQRGDPVTVKDVLDMKADPAAMRKLKDIGEIDGLGGELGQGGAINVQKKFNETLQTKVYEPSYEEVSKSLKGKYGEVKVDTIRTPGKEYHAWDINTDNDIVAKYKVTGPDGKVEWKEIPRSEWEDTYFQAYAKNTGFDPQDAAQKFPHEDWGKMTPAEQCRKWGELHGESPTDVYHPEGARDFSTERTGILNGQAPDKAAAAQAAQGEGLLMDSEGLGLMEKNKINHYWDQGGIKNQTEAMEQLRKAASQAQKLENGYKSMGYKINDMPDNMQDAIKAVNDSSMSPASRAARLAELGYDSPGDFVDKLTSRIGSLRAARK